MKEKNKGASSSATISACCVTHLCCNNSIRQNKKNIEMFNSTKYLEESITLSKYESMMDMRKWTKEIPNLQFPSEWQIRIIPPFAGAVVRFMVFKERAYVSVYLDCYGKLGCYDGPYWEIYPDAEYTNVRFDMNDTAGLLKAIGESLNKQLSSDTEAQGSDTSKA
jgi:hypothetical protein